MLINLGLNNIKKMKERKKEKKKFAVKKKMRS